MHAISHSLAHRGPGASRARTRWQPYTCTTLNSSTPPTLSRSPQQYLNTPNSSVLPPTTTISPAILHSARSAQPSTSTKSTPASGGPLREHKYKYVAGLVDQAVKSLCDIWQPEDIPAVFRAKSASSFDSLSTDEYNTLVDEPLIHHTVRNVQLPSPISPTTRPSPISTSPITPTAQIAAASCRTNQVVPLRGFVHEVLRRSRTSTSVLQTALCYLEAVRSKIPELIALEKAKANSPDDSRDEVIEDRIVLGDVIDGISGFSGFCEDTNKQTFDYVQTVRVGEASMQEPLTAPPTEMLTFNEPFVPPAVSTSSKHASPPLPPLPALPSPLRCPRRTFLACLILASKFLQDRSYSNKAWAKLAGLPPREIGRCERAVGEALEWRLWVGKTPATSSTPVGTHRAVARCRSETTVQLPTCGWPTSTAPAAPFTSRTTAVRSLSAGLRRSATVPEIGSAVRINPVSSISVDAWMAASSMPVATSLFSAELELDTDTNAQQAMQVGASGEHVFSSQMSSIFAHAPSPPLCTPPLVYSPMSTASNASSDDGDRTAQFCSFIDMPCRVGSSAKFAGNTTGQGSGYSHPLEQSFTHLQLAAINPFVVTGPVQLPPLSEAVSNPALLEATINPTHGLGDTLNAYNSYGNWSVSS